MGAVHRTSRPVAVEVGAYPCAAEVEDPIAYFDTVDNAAAAAVEAVHTDAAGEGVHNGPVVVRIHPTEGEEEGEEVHIVHHWAHHDSRNTPDIWNHMERPPVLVVKVVVVEAVAGKTSPRRYEAPVTPWTHRSGSSPQRPY